MSWLEQVQSNIHDVAAKAGLTPEKLKHVTDTLNAELAKVPDHAKALAATAEQHGIPVAKIQEALAHAGAELGKAADEVAAQVGSAFNKNPPA